MKTFFKVLLVGMLTVSCRLVFQLLIPDTDQTVLPPSIFVVKGLLPLVFTVYGFVTYSAISALFLLVRNHIHGTKILQGIKYGAAYCALWVVYLWEPLPHQASIMIDGIAYCIADGAGLLIMGVFTGLLLGQNNL